MRTLLSGVIAAAVAFSQAPASPPPPTGSLVLAGRVITGSGPDARPVRHARVTLSGGSLKIPRLADSDAKGEYRFDHLPASTYRVSVQKPGFVKLDADARPDAVLTMARGGAIEGIVADTNGNPVMNVAVSALVQQAGGGAPRVVTQTRTDDLGRYRLHSLDGGEYVIQAATVGGSSSALAYPAGQDLPVSVAAYYGPSTSVEREGRARRSRSRRHGHRRHADAESTITNPAASRRAHRKNRGLGALPDALLTRPLAGRLGTLLLLLATEGQRLTNRTSTDSQGRFEYRPCRAEVRCRPALRDTSVSSMDEPGRANRVYRSK